MPPVLVPLYVVKIILMLTEIKTYALYIHKSRLVNYGDKLIKVYGPLLWNSIPEEIQDASSVQTFKLYLKKYFLGSYKSPH